MNRYFSTRLLLSLFALLLSSSLWAAGQPTVMNGELNFLGSVKKQIKKQVLYGPYYAKQKEVENRFDRPLAPGLLDRKMVDSVLQNSPAAVNMNPPIASFDGISNVDQSGLSGFFFTPPDTVGDVGPSHYVQMVNTAVEVFDKNGNSLVPPFLLSTLFPNTSICGQTNDGDPIILYDELANRWLLSQFVFDFPSHECIAISQTGNPDPAAGYFLYDFVNPVNKFADYPKIGVWPDGYYMTTNMFNASTFGGVGVFVFERAQMLLGNAAKFILFDLSTFDLSLFGLQPADVDGAAPPGGTPNYVAGYMADEFGDPSDQIRLFDVTVNFAPVTPTGTFVERGESPLIPAAFDPNLCNLNPCIKQKGTTQKVDSLAQDLMYRLQYRHIGSTEKLVVNQTVDANGADRAGIRYYEMSRNLPAGAFSIAEQATFSPDNDSRWMGSAALDKDGNLAIGYSVSSSNTFPSIRYTGRLAGDPAGSFQGENTLFAGSGSQTNSNRWGDYSALMVDPGDGCTFWYTTEYYPATDQFRWHTRVGTFRFGLLLSPASIPVALNGQPYNQAITASGGTGPFTFTISSGALPNGLTLSSGGVISGTPSDTDGVYNITVHVVDTGSPSGCTGNSDKSYVLRLGCLYCDDFEDGTPPNWTIVKPTWTQSGGEYLGSSTKKAISVATPSFLGCNNCTIEADMKTAGGAGNTLWLLGWFSDKSNDVELLMKEEKDRWILKQRVGGNVLAKGKGVATILPNQNYHVTATFDGSVFQIFVDGNLLITMPKAVASSPNGTVGFQAKATTGHFGSILVF